MIIRIKSPEHSIASTAVLSLCVLVGFWVLGFGFWGLGLGFWGYGV